MIDHFVLPVASLEVAAGHLAYYGFTVAPQGQHPFGTANRCIYLQHGCFLEFLAISDRGAYETAIQENNEFIKRDRLWRKHNGDDGFSALVLASDDAFLDHANFVADAVSAGNVLDFSRPFVLPDGSSDVASFRLAFAADSLNKDIFFFTCQRVGVPAVDRSILEKHANGVETLKTVYMTAEKPLEFRTFLQTVLRCKPTLIEPDLLCFQLGNAEIRVMTRDKLRELTNTYFPTKDNLSLQGIGFKVSTVQQTKSYFEQNQVPYTMVKDRFLVVPKHPSSPFFIFEE